MAICPFFEESMWNGNKCKASGGKDGAPIQKRYADYCGANFLSEDWKNLQKAICESIKKFKCKKNRIRLET